MHWQSRPRVLGTACVLVSLILLTVSLVSQRSSSASSDLAYSKEGLQAVFDNGGAGGVFRDLGHALFVKGFPEDMLEAMDVGADPCDDFYQFACGRWNAENKPVLERSVYKSDITLAWDEATTRARDKELLMLANDPGPAGIMYRSCMDVDHIEEIGGKPLKPWLSLIDSITDKDSLARVVAVLNQHNINTLFSWSVGKDPRNSSQNVFSIHPGGGTLPDKKYYLESSPQMEQHRHTFMIVMLRFFQMMGYEEEDAHRSAAMILNFETKIANIAASRADARKDHGKTTPWSELLTLTPWWPWETWREELSKCQAPPDGSQSLCPHDHVQVRAIGMEGGTPIRVLDEDFFVHLDALLNDTSMDTFKALLRWRLIQNCVIYLSSPYIDLYAVLKGFFLLLINFYLNLFYCSIQQPVCCL